MYQKIQNYPLYFQTIGGIHQKNHWGYCPVETKSCPLPEGMEQEFVERLNRLRMNFTFSSYRQHTTLTNVGKMIP